MRTLKFFTVDFVGTEIHCNVGVTTVSYDSNGAVDLRSMVSCCWYCCGVVLPLKELVRDKRWKGSTVLELVTLTRRLSDSVPSLGILLATVMLGFFQVEVSTSLQR